MDRRMRARPIHWGPVLLLLAAAVACHGPDLASPPSDSPAAPGADAKADASPDAQADPSSGLFDLPAQEPFRDPSLDPEWRYVNATLSVLPALDLRPAFVSADLLRSSIPPASRDLFDPSSYLWGDWIDASHSRFLLRYQWGALATNLLVVSSRGVLLSLLRFERIAHVALRDVSGDDTPEIFVDVVRSIHGTYSMDGGEPQDWEIYEASGRKIGTIAQSGPWPPGTNPHTGDPALSFFRRLELPRKGHVTVVTTTVAGQLSCGCAPGCPACRSMPPRVGDREEYAYVAGRFAKVSDARGPTKELPCGCGSLK